MPGIDELLRAAGEQWRGEIDAHHEPSTAPAPRVNRWPWATYRGRVWTASIGGLAAAAVLVLAVGLNGGSGSDGSNELSTAGGAAVAGPAKAPLPQASRAPVGAYGSARTTVPPAAGSTAPTSTALILTGSLSLTVRTNPDVDRAATKATGIADGAGGRVDADTRSAGPHHSATLVLRVPNATLPTVTKQLSALGTVTSQQLQTKDVTAQVADVDSRVTSARAAIAALDRLYAKAQTVKDLITVESALAARQSDLEALEAQQRSLAAQTSLATLTLSIDVHAPAARKHHHRSGFTGGLHHGWHAFTTTARALATAAGAVLPFAVLLLIVAAVALVAVRGRRRSRAVLAERR